MYSNLLLEIYNIDISKIFKWFLHNFVNVPQTIVKDIRVSIFAELFNIENGIDDERESWQNQANNWNQ